MGPEDEVFHFASNIVSKGPLQCGVSYLQISPRLLGFWGVFSDDDDSV